MRSRGSCVKLLVVAHTLACTLLVSARAVAGAAPQASAGESAFKVWPRPPAKQNVLLIISDDLRAEIDALGFACTAAKCSTPTLGALSRSNGTVAFTRAYVQQALCAPSRNSFLVGRRPDTTKAWNFVDSFREKGVGANWTTLPGYFRKAGWNVFGTGKVFHPHLPPNWDLPFSWDARMADGAWEGWMYPAEPRCPNGTVWCAVDDTGDASEFEDLQVTARALALLQNLTADGEEDKPWFLAVGFRKPHVQWRAPTQFFDKVPLASATLPKHRLFPQDAPPVAFHMPENDFLQPFTDVAGCGGVALMAPNRSFPDHCLLKWRRAYHASVAFMDDQVRQLLGAVDAAGATDKTIICFFGDHGWQLGEWAEWEKFTNFELAARVPLLIKAPWLAGRHGARASNALTELIDVMPTLIQLADPGALVPAGVEGTSLLPLIAPPTAARHTPVWSKTMALTQFPRCCKPGKPLWKDNDCDDVPRSKFTHMGLSIRTDRWRFTRWLKWQGDILQPAWEAPDDGTELYDHSGDQGLSMDGDYEAVNVAGRFPAVVKQLSAALRRAFPAPPSTASP